MKSTFWCAVGGVFVLVSSTAACTTSRDLCADLETDLQRCGVPVMSLECGRIDRSAQEELVQRIDELGCRGLAASSDGDALDPNLCEIANFPCPASPTPAPSAHKTRYPLVFVSGIDGSATFDWNPRIVAAVRDLGGSEASHVTVLPWATTPERTSDLWQSLEAVLRGRDTKLNLVCYAVGGLDCRYLVAENGLFADDPGRRAEVVSHIASITTIATPHRGTRVADAARAALKSGAAQDFLPALVGTVADGPALPAVPSDGTLTKTLDGLTLEALLAFNRRIFDAEGVYYQSFAGVSHVLGRSSVTTESAIREHCVGENGEALYFRHPDTRDALNQLLWITAPFADASLDAEGKAVSSPADGMVSIESAKWGKFRGCIPADHYDVIGQIGNTTRDPLTGFDARLFYRWVASDLAERGF